MDGRKKCGKNHTTSPRSAESACAASTCTAGERGFTHPRVGQAERLAYRWQPNAFCGLAPTPTFAARWPKGRERNQALPGYRLCGLLDFAMPLTKKPRSHFSLSLSPRTILSLFAPVSRCVGRMGPGWHPCPCRLSFAAVGSLCGNAQIPLSPMPSGSYECSDNSSHNPWLSRKSSGMVCFPAAPYQNFYAREETETWRREQETGSSPSG